MLQALTELGLTESEAKVYLMLLDDHPATGYQLSKSSGVPRSQVYEALGRLENRGAVLKTEEEKATLYRPVDPQLLLDRHQRETDERVARLRGQLGQLYRGKPDARVWNFTGRRETWHYVREMAARARRELMLVLNDSDLAQLRPALQEAHARGVRLGVLLTGHEELLVGEVVRHPPQETELHHMEETLVVVADEEEVLIASPTSQTTVTSNPNLVLISRQFIWMELFSQRIFARLGEDLLERLDPEDRHVLERSV